MVYRVDRVIHSDPAGIQQALSELGQKHVKSVSTSQNVELPSGRCQARGGKHRMFKALLQLSSQYVCLNY